MEMAQYFQQMVLKQADTCINTVFYFLYFIMFWHLKKFASWGGSVPPRANQRLTQGLGNVFHMQPEQPHYLIPTHQVFIAFCSESSQCQVPSNETNKLANPIPLIPSHLALPLETLIKALYSAFPLLLLLLHQTWYLCGPTWYSTSPSLRKCK